MPNLYVAMYHSAKGIYEHWALFLENDKDTIYEVIGEIPTFKPNVLFRNPAHTKKHKRNVLLYNIKPNDMPDFENVLAAMKMDKQESNPEWNCQNYIVEVLEALEEKGVINKDDEAYVEAKKQVMEHFGPLPQIGKPNIDPSSGG